MLKPKPNNKGNNTCNDSMGRREVRIVDQGYAPHRHDTYTLALTLQGVQSFHYRGSRRNALPGDVVILHPDEVHDGKPISEEGFTYRCIEIQPQHIQKALGKKTLPFIDTGISSDARMQHVATQLLGSFDTPLEPFEYEEHIHALAHVMHTISGNHPIQNTINTQAVELARTYIEDSLDQDISLDELEHVCGYRRRQLCRDFRSVTGTSPYRYLIMRRLDKARQLIIDGQPLSLVAVETNFSDQSHFNRHFKKAFGLTPKRWLQLMA